MSNKLADILIRYPDNEILTADGLDDAILGTVEVKQTNQVLVAYSRSLVIGILMNRDKMDFDEAEEFYEFNIVGAYMGELTPLFVDDEFFD